MGIVTGRGDSGDTDFRGGRLPKDDPAIEALGGMDELQAFLADAAHSLPEAQGADLRVIVADCSAAMSVLAGFDDGKEFARGKVGFLEDGIREMETGFALKGFALPGKTPGSAKLDICRTVCRRAERSIVTYGRLVGADPGIGVWLNRLSDYLFLMARRLES